MKNAFYFIFKSSFGSQDVLEIQKKRLDLKDKVNCKTYDVTAWSTNNYNTHSKGNQTMKFGQLIEYSKKNIFLQKS